MKKPPFTYGKSPNPANWHEGAEALKSVKDSRKKPKGGSLIERLDRIEQRLTENNHA